MEKFFHCFHRSQINDNCYTNPECTISTRLYINLILFYSKKIFLKISIIISEKDQRAEMRGIIK